MKIFTFLLLCAINYNVNAVSLYDNNGNYLGEYNSNQYDYNSTSNPYGPHGSKYSYDSINNPYGPNGSQYSYGSANNPYSTGYNVQQVPVIRNPYYRY
jgi:hypothetical protein